MKLSHQKIVRFRFSSVMLLVSAGFMPNAARLSTFCSLLSGTPGRSDGLKVWQ